MMRSDVLKEIGRLLDKKCGACRIREELNKINGAKFARTDGHCIRECEVGHELQELGKILGRGADSADTFQRQQRREWMLQEDAVEMEEAMV